METERDWIFITAAPFKADMLERACAEVGITVEDVKGTSQVREVCIKRWRVIRILRNRFRWSLPKIGLMLNKHHATVLYALRRLPVIEEEMRNGTYVPRHPNGYGIKQLQAAE